jgi:hypothetical protein
MMVGAHLVWGATLGFSEALLARAGNQILDARSRKLR